MASEGERLWRLSRLVHSDNKGVHYCEHDVWDLSDPAVPAEASTLSDHMIEWHCGNEVGFGIMGYGVGPGYYKYK